MQNNFSKTKDLLEKYRTDNILPEEFDSLVESIDSVTDATLSQILSEQWDQFPAETGNIKDFHRKRRVPLYTALVSCAATILLVLCIGLGWRVSEMGDDMAALNSSEVTVKSGNEGRMSLMLPDGTNVMLNARSSITYPMDFGVSERSVKMSGEGYFDVTPDKEKEFTVTTQDMRIVVHGTKFNIYAYPENDFSEMSLIEGSVSLTSGNSEMKVSPNEKVCISRNNGRITVLKTDNELETVWMKNRLIFIHEPLYHVFEILQRKFGVQIESHGIDLSDLYTGTFREHSVTEILNVLKLHYGFRYEIKDNHIYINTILN